MGRSIRSSQEGSDFIVYSSNLIRWEGKLPCCLKICKGDTVSDVVAKLAQRECNTEAAIDLTTLNMQGIVTTDKTILSVLQGMVNEIKSLKDQVAALSQ